MTLGLRRGEVLALKWPDVDFEASTVHVGASLQRVNGKLELSETKATGSRRPFPLLESVAKALRSHRVRQHQERLVAGSRWQDMGLFSRRGLTRLTCLTVSNES